MSQCNPAVNAFSTVLDINNSEPQEYKEDEQDGFYLHSQDVFAACQQAAQPFQTFCLQPDPNNLLTQNMCNLETTQTDVPDALFERLIRGEIKHPDDLPSIFESADIPDFVFPRNIPWITAQTFGPQANIPITPNQPGEPPYLGLQTLPVCADIGVADDCKCMHVLIEGRLHEAQADGFVRPTFWKPPFAPEDEMVEGNDSSAQSVLVSASGNIRCTLFSDKLFLFANKAWTQISPEAGGVAYFKAVMWQSAALVNLAIFWRPTTSSQNTWFLDIYQLQDNTIGNPPDKLIPKITYTQVLSNPIAIVVFAFLTVTFLPETQGFLLTWATTSIPYDIQTSIIINTVTMSADGTTLGTVQYARWNTGGRGLQFPLLPVEPTSCGSYSSYFSNQEVKNAVNIRTTLFNDRMFRLLLDLDSTNILLIESQLGQTVLKESYLNHVTRVFVFQQALYQSINQTLLIVGNQFTLTSPNPLNFSFGIAPNGQDVWYFQDNKLWRLHKTAQGIFEPAAWTNGFNLYSPRRAACSDFGSPSLNKDIWNPGDSTWYLGTRQKSSQIEFDTRLPRECVRSPHDIFRFAVTDMSSQDNGLIAFPHIFQFELQRVNEYAMFLQALTQIADDSNVQVLRSSTDILWQSSTHDRTSDLSELEKADFNPNSAPFAQASKNGLYLIYLQAPKNRVRLVFNAYNSLRLARWVTTQPEYLTRALTSQSNFCWNALKDPTEGSTAFADSRCICIGGQRLLNVIAPNADALPSSVIAPLQENLPCLAKGCNVGVNFMDSTVGMYFLEKCANRGFVFCDSVLRLGADSKLDNGSIIQNTVCLTNQQFCSATNACGPGFTCFNGKCITACANDQQCAKYYPKDSLIYRCEDGKCLPSLKPEKSKLSTTAILAIISAVALLVIVLVFVGLMSARAKKQKK